jgi:hypothetical protein
MENNHTCPQAAEDDDLYDDLDDSWISDAGSVLNDNLDEETQSPPAYQPQPSLCIVRKLISTVYDHINVSIGLSCEASVCKWRETISYL